MKVARVAYLIALVILLFVLLASINNSFVANWLIDICGKRAYNDLHDSINYPVIGFLSSIDIIQLLVPLIFFIVCAIITVRTVELVRKNIREEREIKIKKPVNDLFAQVVNKNKFNTKIYLTNCVMLC